MIRVDESFDSFRAYCCFRKTDHVDICNHDASVIKKCLEPKYCPRIVQKKAKEPSELKPVEFTVPNHLQEVWPHFLEMRTRIKKPATARAQKNLIADLERMAPANWELQKAMVEQSITHSWQGIYEIKGNYSNSNKLSFLR
jgi:hypothetical protein